MKSNIWRLGLGLSLAAALAGCQQRNAANRYLTEAVAVADVEKVVMGTGLLQPLTVVEVGAQASGQIQSMKVDVGTVVNKGDVIAIIDPSTQQTTLRNAQASLTQAQAQKAQQQATQERVTLEMARQQSLLDRGFASQATYERARADLLTSQAQERSLDAQISQAQANLEKATVDLSRTTIVAPIAGVVAAVLVREGQTVNAVQQAPTIVRLARLDVMTVRAQISEADVISVHPGQKVYFTVLGDPETKHYGTLRGIEPAPDNANAALTGQPNQPVYYNAVFDVPNPDGVLKPGMTAEVNVVLEEAPKVLAMPSGGLGERNADGTYKVRVMGANGKPETRNVRIGINDNVHAQVLSGLKAGDKVVMADAFDASISGQAPAEKQNGGNGGGG